MRKVIAWIICLTLALSAAGAFAENADSVFEELQGKEWSFASGAGAWSTDLRIASDGTFSGEFHDSDMGDSEETYPNGTVYHCSFTGKMSVTEQTGETSWKVRVEALKMEGASGEEVIEDGVRYVTAEAYGLSAGDEMVLYGPGTPVSMLTEDMLFWVKAIYPEAGDGLDGWLLYSEANQSGFVSWNAEAFVGLANPWEEMDAEKLKQVSGLSFGVPEGAENIVWRYLKSEGLAEMQFMLDGAEYCARVQPAVLQEGEWMNISGMYFAWENEMDVEIRGCRGTLGDARTGSEDMVELCQWYDEAAGLMYCLSVFGTDLDGLDLTVYAEQCMPAAAE